MEPTSSRGSGSFYLRHIFTYLSPGEKANVRATCTYLRTLVDHPSLWKRSTIVFKSIGVFNARFWDTLQSRKISSVEVTRVTLKQFKKMTSSLPDLTSVTMDSCLKGEILQGLRPLLNLQQLHLTDCSNVTDQEIGDCTFSASYSLVVMPGVLLRGPTTDQHSPAAELVFPVASFH